jgi:hypothetical protein
VPETGGAPATQLLAAKVSAPEFWGNVRNSADTSKGFFQSGMCKFESSQVSQAVWCLERMSPIPAESPANGGLSQISCQSPGSDFRLSQREIADSLRRTIGKLRFSGDCGLRPGSDLHCVAELAVPPILLEIFDAE